MSRSQASRRWKVQKIKWDDEGGREDVNEEEFEGGVTFSGGESSLQIVSAEADVDLVSREKKQDFAYEHLG